LAIAAFLASLALTGAAVVDFAAVGAGRAAVLVAVGVLVAVAGGGAVAATTLALAVGAIAAVAEVAGCVDEVALVAAEVAVAG
jgi:hypothetical protein